jgi:hypothetical protein
VRTLLACCAALSLVAAAPAFASTEVRVGIDIGNAPPPPAFEVRVAPRFEYVPRERVYVVNDPAFDYDCFRYGGWYYVSNDGWWYRSRGLHGRFVAVETRFVPRPIFAMSDREYHWRHAMPPGQWKKMQREERGERREHGHGRGHDKGGDRD